MPDHLYTTHDRLVGRSEHEARLGQSGQVIWFYGLSGSGKTTIAAALQRMLHDQGRYVVVLDGDNIRSGLNNNLGFSDSDRKENIRRIAEVAKLLAQSGAIVLASFITPTRELRERARSIVGDDLTTIYVKASFETCQKRDPKGLYAKVASGKVKQFTGKDSGFEEPMSGDLDAVIDTETHDLGACVEQARTLVKMG
ncbi:MAG: adenylyl-sulfate kinase [Synoicihabitans sp.]